MHDVPQPPLSRRTALKAVGIVALSAGLGSRAIAREPAPAAKPASKPSAAAPLFTISLAQWSLNRAIRNKTLDHLDFPKVAKADYGIDAVEYVNTLFGQGAKPDYVRELKKRCDDLAVTSVLIMCDGEGALGDADNAKRTQAVDNHRKWLDASKILGCHSIRVNAQSAGSFEEQQRLAADGLRKLCEVADPLNLNVIVENHGGLSSNGEWLAGVMKKVDHNRVGTLPDFGNFCMDWSKKNDPASWYDRYKGVAELMPFAKGVSAKSHDFNDEGNETNTDYRRMMKIVLDAGYKGHVGIEYEGSRLSEPEGIRATKKLLEKVRDEMSK